MSMRYCLYLSALFHSFYWTPENQTSLASWAGQYRGNWDASTCIFSTACNTCLPHHLLFTNWLAQDWRSLPKVTEEHKDPEPLTLSTSSMLSLLLSMKYTAEKTAQHMLRCNRTFLCLAWTTAKHNKQLLLTITLDKNAELQQTHTSTFMPATRQRVFSKSEVKKTQK